MTRHTFTPVSQTVAQHVAEIEAKQAQDEWDRALAEQRTHFASIIAEAVSVKPGADGRDGVDGSPGRDGVTTVREVTVDSQTVHYDERTGFIDGSTQVMSDGTTREVAVIRDPVSGRPTGTHVVP